MGELSQRIVAKVSGPAWEQLRGQFMQISRLLLAASPDADSELMTTYAKFTVHSDASSPVQTASRTLALTIGSGLVSIWPGTAVPTLVDGGPDSAVELGVKFRSDTVGSVTGIRFYKASANTGAHIGNLWTSAGAR